MILRMQRRTFAALIVAIVAVGGLAIAGGSTCLSAWVRYGVALDHCPDGKVRATWAISARELRRGGGGEVVINARAVYAREDRERAEVEAFDSFDAELSLVSGDGQEQPLPLAEDTAWRSEDGSQVAKVAVPQLPDGEYTLRAKLSSRLGEETVDVPVAFFAPARVQVITDRPLYEPGHQVKFRAVVLRAQDLTPLDGRPGRWFVVDPNGETVLEEKSPAGPWGVATGSFPLDRGASTGTWRVRWTSGDASDEAAITVEPFTVPRFRVELATDKAAYAMGDRPVVKGAVLYASGAPVAGAKLELEWRVIGEWPAPLEWEEGALPRTAKTGRDGRFALELPEVPYDLRGRNTLVADVAAVDSAGDRITSSVALLLSEDRLQVDAVTELGDGLVQGFNNRLYLRAATAEGRPLAGAELTITRAWDARDPGVTATTDEDGVASLQIDPGAPVNVVIPAMPYRPPPPEPSVQLTGLTELFRGGPANLADQVALERSLSKLERCALYALSHESRTLAIRLTAAGRVSDSTAQPDRLGRCLEEAARALSFPAGGDRLLALSLQVAPADAPLVHAFLNGSPDVPEGLNDVVQDALLAARPCLPRNASPGMLSRSLAWRTHSGSDQVQLSWVASPGGLTTPEVLSCLAARVPRVEVLPQEQSAPAIGLARLRLQPPQQGASQSRPQATTYLGYEFQVTAVLDGRKAGSTRLRMRPGQVPPLRLRPSSVVATPGQPLELDVLRGPSHSGELPEEAFVTVGPSVKKLKVDVERRKVRYEVPKDASGWLAFELAGARALVYVQTGSDLSVSLTADREAYAPGALAHLTVQTLRGGAPTAAAVGLFGVDETLGQLVPLPGAETFAEVRPVVAMSAPAFGVLDAQALIQGRIRGANAAAATVLRVSSLPSWAQADAPVAAALATQVDANGELTDAFYNVLGELHAQARRWEASAPKDVMASPKTIAELWAASLEAVEERGEKVTDAFGRKVRLSMLPPDLLALTDPRAVVIAGTRLPEDVENWSQWVAEEAP